MGDLPFAHAKKMGDFFFFKLLNTERGILYSYEIIGRDANGIRSILYPGLYLFLNNGFDFRSCFDSESVLLVPDPIPT